MSPGDDLVEDDPQRVEVRGWLVDEGPEEPGLSLHDELPAQLGREIPGGTRLGTGSVSGRRRGPDATGAGEVGQLRHPAWRHQDVGWLDVPVPDALRVHVAQHPGELLE